MDDGPFADAYFFHELVRSFFVSFDAINAQNQVFGTGCTAKHMNIENDIALEKVVDFKPNKIGEMQQDLPTSVRVTPKRESATIQLDSHEISVVEIRVFEYCFFNDHA
jgi:hypothetical protein